MPNHYNTKVTPSGSDLMDSISSALWGVGDTLDSGAASLGKALGINNVNLGSGAKPATGIQSYIPNSDPIDDSGPMDLTGEGRTKVAANAGNTKDYANTIALQRYLNTIGANLAEDGINGPLTQAANATFNGGPASVTPAATPAATPASTGHTYDEAGLNAAPIPNPIATKAAPVATGGTYDEAGLTPAVPNRLTDELPDQEVKISPTTSKPFTIATSRGSDNSSYSVEDAFNDIQADDNTNPLAALSAPSVRSPDGTRRNALVELMKKRALERANQEIGSVTQDMPPPRQGPSMPYDELGDFGPPTANVPNDLAQEQFPGAISDVLRQGRQAEFTERWPEVHGMDDLLRQVQELVANGETDQVQQILAGMPPEMAAAMVSAIAQ
jgi:hypothetical protein